MKKLVFISFLFIIGFGSLFASFSLFAQDTIAKDTVYTVLKDMPEFPGGEIELYQFIGKNYKGDYLAKDEGISGRVIVNFIVQADGNLTDVKIVRSVHEKVDNEAIRVVKLMPKWMPGTKDGAPVAVSYNLPFGYIRQ